jgi:hypothetical protein
MAGTTELLEGLLVEHSVVRDGLDFREATIGGKSDLPESGQVLQALPDIDFSGVVDGRLGT